MQFVGPRRRFCCMCNCSVLAKRAFNKPRYTIKTARLLVLCAVIAPLGIAVRIPVAVPRRKANTRRNDCIFSLATVTRHLGLLSSLTDSPGGSTPTCQPRSTALPEISQVAEKVARQLSHVAPFDLQLQQRLADGAVQCAHVNAVAKVVACNPRSKRFSCRR